MFELLTRFISDLDIPSETKESLFIPRTNQELKIYALTLPTLKYPDSYKLAGRIYMLVNIKNCPQNTVDYVEIAGTVLRDDIKNCMLKYEKEIDELLDETYYKNFEPYTILSASSCINYLLKISNDENPIETPCQMLLRQAIEFYFDESWDKIKNCYYELIDQLYIHASPTMFNAGLKKNQLASCFLLNIGDNLESLVYTGVGDTSMISRLHAGIGLSMSAIRDSEISGAGKSSGIMPFARMYDDTIRCVDQGGKRNGAMTITLIDWHIDFMEFIQARDNYTDNGIRLYQANTCVFISRLFMDRVKKNQNWTFFCPARAKIDDEALLGKHGHTFEEFYLKLEEAAFNQKKYFDKLDDEVRAMEKIVNSGDVDHETNLKYYEKLTKRIKMRKKLIVYKTMNARDIYTKLCDMHVKSAMPYMVYRDPVNEKNNMSNIGPTENLNLCVAPETLILTDKGEHMIHTLVNKKVKVWNGEVWSDIEVKLTGKNKKLIRIIMREDYHSDFKSIDCTPEHKFYDSENNEVRAKDLTPGTKLCPFKLPTKEYKSYTVVEVDMNLNRYSDTYCFTEPFKNRGIFNGILTGNCLEITEPSTPDSIASCNLGHLNLKAFVVNSDKELNVENIKEFYDFAKLGKAIQSLVNNINKVIDHNYYPLDKRNEKGEVIEQGKISIPNLENRPMGIGVSGLAEVFALIGIPYDSPEAFRLNRMIFCAMYYYALKQSNELAKKEGEYKNFRTGETEVFVDGKWQKIKGSPMANGYFQFDLWQQEADYLMSIDRLNTKIYNVDDNIPVSPEEWGLEETWDSLREDIVKNGVRNAMLIALMPTASSSQMLRNAETTEAHQTLVYARKLVHGNYTAFSEPFVDDMIKHRLWNKETIDFVMMSNGSISKLDYFVADNQQFFPEDFYTDGKIKAAKLAEIQKLQKIHRGMFEISQCNAMQMARQRAIGVCQSQSFNVYVGEPNIKIMSALHYYSYSLGLKTGMYYLRANPASQTDRFTVDIKVKDYHKNINNRKAKPICTDEVCIMCQ